MTLCFFDTERELLTVRCRGCRRTLALSTGLRLPTYCNEMCASDFPAVENEDRNALLYAMFRSGTSQGELANAFGITRQFVSKIVNERMRLK